MRRVPGLALAGAGVALSLGAREALTALPPLVLCVALGVALANIGHVPAAAAPGLRTAAGPVLKLGVVLLGSISSFRTSSPSDSARCWSS